jgi:fatty-acid peroxygenase
MPRARGFDHSYAFLREGYDFIGNRCAELGSDVFRARLMLWRVICMRGASAAEVFYASDKFTRRGAMPLTVLMLLQDFGSVQMLDGKAHRHRKAMFTAIGRPQAADDDLILLWRSKHVAPDDRLRCYSTFGTFPCCVGIARWSAMHGSTSRTPPAADHEALKRSA